MLTRRPERRNPRRWAAGGRGLRRRPHTARRVGVAPGRVCAVQAIGCDRRVPTAAGLMRADEITAAQPKGVCQRYYDWALIPHPDPAGHTDPNDPADGSAGGCWCLPVRSNRTSVSWPSTAAATPQTSCRYANWSASPDADATNTAPEPTPRTQPAHARNDLRLEYYPEGADNVPGSHEVMFPNRFYQGNVTRNDPAAGTIRISIGMVSGFQLADRISMYS